jgi:hypothetical protein
MRQLRRAWALLAIGAVVGPQPWLRARLDSLAIRYADSTFEGRHVDRVRERITRHLLPAVERWLAAGAQRTD